MFGSKSCRIRVAIDTVSSVRADTTFDEWTYARVFIHLHFLFRAFSNLCVSVNTLSLSRVDTVISRSGSPHDASHLPSSKSIHNVFIACRNLRLHMVKTCGIGKTVLSVSCARFKSDIWKSRPSPTLRPRNICPSLSRSTQISRLCPFSSRRQAE